MAESVDALVSNTSGETRAGSTPALGTKVPMCGKKDALVSMKARCCKTTTYSTISFYKTKDFLSKFSPHFPHRCKFDAINYYLFFFSLFKKLQNSTKLRWITLPTCNCSLYKATIVGDILRFKAKRTTSISASLQRIMPILGFSLDRR